MNFEIVKPQLTDVDALATLWHPTFILKQNVGQALMTAAEDFARAEGFRFVKLMASKHNDAALRFYERIG